MVALGVATYIPDCSPRKTGCGATASRARPGVLQIVAPQIVVLMYASGGIKDVLSVIIGALMVMVAMLAVLGIETNQRSLEEISPQYDEPVPAPLRGHEITR